MSDTFDTRGAQMAHAPTMMEDDGTMPAHPPAMAHGADDAHAGHHDDPNAAPMHHDLAEISTGHVIIAWILGLAAIAAGIVFGIVLAND